MNPRSDRFDGTRGMIFGRYTMARLRTMGGCVSSCETVLNDGFIGERGDLDGGETERALQMRQLTNVQI